MTDPRFITVHRLWDALGEKAPTEFLVNVADVMSVDEDEWRYKHDDGGWEDEDRTIGRLRVRGMKADDTHRIVESPAVVAVLIAAALGTLKQEEA